MNAATTISSLPSELLGAIAVAGQEERVADSYGPDPQWHTDSKIHNFSSEWVLSHVSRRFRGVMINSPALWTLIGVDLDVLGSVEMFKLYLDRSRACKISITLREDPKDPDADLDDDAMQLMFMRVTQIVPHINRIRTLRIWFGTKRIMELLRPFRDLAALHLQHLEIINLSDDRDASLAIFSSGAPKLNFVRLSCLTLDLPASPWTASLTDLRLWGYRVDWGINNLVPLTAQCPSLVHLRFATHFRTRGDRVHIPTLKSLHITISFLRVTPSDLLDILNLFDAPALTEFTADGSHGDQICRLFNSTNHKSTFPALTSLSFSRFGPCPCDAESIFYRTISSPPALFPALSSLTLINQCFAHHLIRDILGPDSPSWPHLNTVTLVPKEHSLQDVRSAVEDVVTKRQLGQPFPVVKLCRPRRLEDWSVYFTGDVEIASFP
ncbi:F-box domain-containing protein [Mycena sanguinolenta]|uniref:F-box domain-containing protein n=1 Tax=Mycena sanguinolenta TaxID=230812 RepID=A0A8H6YY74_9AGAR|nr:F-box domain-containing protein [Mycena sanguinolenta]